MAADRGAAQRPQGTRQALACLAALSLVGTLAMVPALLFLVDPEHAVLPVPTGVAPARLVVSMSAGSFVASLVAIALGLATERTTRIGAPHLREWIVHRRMPDALKAGLMPCAAVAVALTVVVLATAWALRSQLPALPEGLQLPPVWQGTLLMLGAAVREELLFRLGAVSLLVWIATKPLRRDAPPAWSVWTVIVLVSMLFAAAHLAPASQLLELTTTVAVAATALATLAGIVLGWIYWRYGLLLAIWTHALAGVLIYLAGRGAMAWSG